MPYATQADMTLRFGVDEVTQLTDRALPASGDIDSATLDRALGDADSLINRYLGARYALPLAEPYPSDLVRIACELARYFLHDLAVPEAVRTNYADAVAWLKALAAGNLPLIDDNGNIVPPKTSAFGSTVVPYAEGAAFGSAFSAAWLPS